MKPDSDLHDQFAHLRREHHAAVPAWHPRWTERPKSSELARQPQLSLWRWAVGTAAAAGLALVALLLNESASGPTPNLAHSLPEFFDSTETDPLFADLGLTSAQPSDAFLPIHLTIALP
jgi:hypothetical protein